LRWTAAAIFFLLATTAVQKAIAQPELAEPRPRIALVLSGGAAKGFAHVGVLKVLEEMRVPVHLITATSMGSIMGGLYASGLPPEEIEEIMATVDWNELFRDAPPREDLDFRRKEDDVRYLFDMGLGVRFNGEVILPRGVLVGQKIGLLFRRHTLHVSGIEEFDELPIPYRAVAADIETGEAYVIDHGDLARAMRASMSIPGAFDPVEIDGHLLVDGGVADNMPVDLARALGADVVIAVDVSSPMRTREQLGNVFGIVGQLTSMLSRLNVEEQIPRADVLLDPELGELDGGDYTKAREFVATGEAVARRHADELARYSVSETEYAAYRERHRFKPTAPGRVDFVEIVGNERVDRRVIEARMRIQPGGSLEPSLIEEDISAVYGLGDFTAVQWEVAQRGDQQGIVVRVDEKPWGPNYLNFGMLFDQDGTFTGRVNLTATRLNARGAELRNDIQLGSTLSLQTEFYQPLDFKGRFFVAPGFLLEDADQDVFDEDGREIAVYEVDRQLAAFDAGVQIGRLGELRLGVVRGKAGANVTVGAAELPDFDVDVGGFRGRLVLDRLDSASFPNRGYIASTRFFLSRRGLGSDDSYERFDFQGSAFWPQGRKIWLLSGLAAGSLGSDLPAYDQFTVGGFYSLSGLERGQLRGQYAGVLRGGLLYRLTSQPSLLAKGVYLGAYAEAGNAWERSGDIGEDLIFAGTVLFGVDSFLGPLYIAYGVADTGQDELYVSLGRAF
jgi:NTE family protein